MGRRLNTHVHAVERDEQGNTTHAAVFGPGDEVPDWAQAAITNPDVWTDDDEATPEAEADTPEVEADAPPRPSRSRSTGKQ